MASVTSKIVSKSNPSKILGKIVGVGKSIKEAMRHNRAITRAYARSRNIAEGFYDDRGIFHPIRASADYSPARGDVGGRAYIKGSKRYKKHLRRARKTTKRAYAKRTARRARRGRHGAIS